MSRTVVSNILGLVGAILGGALGVLVVRWLAGQGYYGPVIPGGLAGLGCGLLARHRSVARGLACAVIALLAGLFAEWAAFPFRADDSLVYFITHLHELKTLTYIFLGVGVLIAYWVGRDHIIG